MITPSLPISKSHLRATRSTCANVPEGKVELYNVIENPVEKEKVAEEKPDRAAALKQKLDKPWSTEKWR